MDRGLTRFCILLATLALHAGGVAAQSMDHGAGPESTGVPSRTVAPVDVDAAAGSAAPTTIWWGVGAGAGALRFTCDLCATDRDRGPSLFAVVGAHATPGLRVGLEAGGWTLDDGGVREMLWRTGLTAFFHPDPGSGFHVLAGIGWVGWRADELRYDSGSLNVGVGWEFELLPSWAVGNSVRIDASSWGSFKNEDDRVARDVGLSLLRFEVTLRRR